MQNYPFETEFNNKVIETIVFLLNSKPMIHLELSDIMIVCLSVCLIKQTMNLYPLIVNKYHCRKHIMQNLWTNKFPYL